MSEVTDRMVEAANAAFVQSTGLTLNDIMRETLDAALREQPAPEPVAYIHRQGNHWEVSERHLTDDEKARGWTEEPLYTAPPQRKPLTDEELDALAIDEDGLPNSHLEFARAIEQAHGIGGEE